MNFMHPVLADFPLVGIHPYNDVFAIYRFESMYHIPLGLSKMLQNCINWILSDKRTTPKSMISETGSAKNFRPIKKKVINAKNKFFQVDQRTATEFCLKLNFFKENSWTFPFRLCTDQEIQEMIEAPNIEQTYIAPPFLAATIDHFCGIDNADTTVAFC